MLATLNQRLWNLDEIAGNSKPATWHHNDSTAESVVSSNNSTGSYQPSPMPYHPLPFPHSTMPGSIGFGEIGRVPQVSPQQFPQQPYQYSQANIYQPPAAPAVQQVSSYQPQLPQMSSQPQLPQMSTQPQLPPQMSTQSFMSNAPPSQQFANWSGYAGHAQPGSLDDEDAVPPESNPWDIGR